MAKQRDINRWRKGKQHWNKWADGRLKAKEKLERDERWEVDDEGNALNAETKRWIDAASIDFSNYDFKGSAGFNEFLFPYFAVFSDAQFRKEAHFGKARFYGEAGFHNVTFSGTAWFLGSTFFKDAWFQKGTFSEDAWFNEVTFSGTGRFRDTTFCKVAYFNQATFSCAVRFTDTTFSDEAWFGEATFTDDAWFDGVTFTDLAWFNKSTFSKFAAFGQCTFDGNTIFDGAKFTGDASFRSAESSGPFSLANAEFSVVPDYIQMEFSKPLRLDDIEVQQPGGWCRPGDKEYAARYRALKKIAIESHDHSRELQFFAGEIRESRSSEDRMFSPAWFFSFAYEIFSDFGRSIMRPLVVLFLLALSFAAICGTNVSANWRNTCNWQSDSILPEFYLSFLHSLPIVGFGRVEKRDLALDCLFGSKENVSPGWDVIFIGQNFCSAILIFLFLLALRNHFRIK